MTQKYQFKKIYTIILLVVLLTIQGMVSARPVVNKPLPSGRLRMMARIYMTAGNYDKAREVAENAFSVARTTGVETGEMALCLIDLGTVYSYLGMLSESDQMFHEGVALQKQALFANHPYVAQTYRMLSDVQRREGQLDKSEQSLAQAVSIMLNHCDIQSKEMSPFILESAKLLSARGQFEQAQVNYQMALQTLRETLGSHHLMTANVLESMAQCSLRQSQFDQADEYITEALNIQQNLFGRQNPLMVDAWLTKAKICRVKGQMERSEYYMSKATASVEKSSDVVRLARVYERVNQIRTEGVVASAGMLN